jgi:DNA-binding CsgD family transcriptional regulator
VDSQGGADGPETTLAAALAHIDGPAAIIGSDGRILHANDDARNALGPPTALRATLLEAARAGRPTAVGWTVTRVHAQGGDAEYLLVGPATASLSVDLGPLAERHCLTKRQVEVLSLLVEGRSNKAIADALGVSLRTVEVHVTAVLQQFAVESRAALVATVLRNR